MVDEVSKLLPTLALSPQPVDNAQFVVPMAVDGALFGGKGVNGRIVSG
jgi:hypothetical protein